MPRTQPATTADSEINLTTADFARYSRQLSLAGFGPGAQLALKRARVLVIGAGGLGCPALLYLTAAGVGHITLLDPDRVDTSNLQRQVIFTTDDTGQPKAEVAARRLRALNPLVTIEPHAERFTRDNALALVAAHDVVLDGSDNFATRYLVNDACVIGRRPFVYGAIQGFGGQVSVFNFFPPPPPPPPASSTSPATPPTYRCLFPEPPAPGDAPSCAEAGVLGVLPGIVGTLQATETLKILTGIGRPLAGRLLLVDALTMEMRTLAITADPQNQRLRELPAEDFGQTCATMTQITAANGTDAASPDEITIDELRALRAGGVHRQLIDVREDWERALAAIEPSVHVPLDQLGTPAAEAALAALDPLQPTIVYCARGRRSLKALPALRGHHGFANILSLQGGITAWGQN
ncbi:molybdopterin-synthase adenylyltransferase MoeB [Opitutaceae bacterium TAV4]|nr:molybdopterin-synthase adenylyltransferase MoeB [Opitutaceae bacterium TAV4]